MHEHSKKKTKIHVECQAGKTSCFYNFLKSAESAPYSKHVVTCCHVISAVFTWYRAWGTSPHDRWSTFTISTMKMRILRISLLWHWAVRRIFLLIIILCWTVFWQVDPEVEPTVKPTEQSEGSAMDEVRNGANFRSYRILCAQQIRFLDERILS